MDAGCSDGQVSVCVGGGGLWAHAASSLFRNGGRVAVETGQHAWSKDTQGEHTGLSYKTFL